MRSLIKKHKQKQQQRILIEEEIRGIFFHLFAYGVNDVPRLAVLKHIRNDKSSNDKRRLLLFVPFLLLASRKVCF